MLAVSVNASEGDDDVQGAVGLPSDGDAVAVGREWRCVRIVVRRCRTYAAEPQHGREGRR